MTDASTPISPRRTTWWCTYCGDEHEPRADRTVLDPRYREARCGAAWRVLVADRDQAQHLANTGGKHRPKGTPLGGSMPKAVVRVAEPGETAQAQAQS